MGVRILVVDDSADILPNVRDYFEMNGWTAETVSTGSGALERLSCGASYDAVVLDLGLPDSDGIAICRWLRKRDSVTPVLMLTARDAVDDRVEGLRSGADDYVVKPFSLRELGARIEALLRRSHSGGIGELRVGDLRYDLRTERVFRSEVEIALNPICRRLLKELMRQSPAVVRREQLEERVWDGRPPATDSLRSNLYLLRRAVDKPFASPLIRTHPGVGWSVAADEEA